MISASVIVVLAGVMPFGKDVIVTMAVAVVLFWLPELLATILAVLFAIQKAIWWKMTE